MKVFIYIRVSSEEQAKHGYSLDAQETALRDYCNAHNHVVVGVYKDEGISARKPYTKRPAMVDLLRDLDRIHPDMILFTKLDRWFRNIKEYYKVQDVLDRYKVDWKAIHEEYDTSTASGRLYINIKLSIAQDEADRTSERIKDIQAHQVAQGKVLGGSCPFGYKIEDKRIIFGDDIHIVKDAIDHYMMHQSAHATTRYINDKYGQSFNHTRLLKLFKNPILKGSYRTNPAFCEPLIDSDTWDELQAIITRNIKHASKKNVYLFSGLIRCPYCGRSLGGMYDGSRKYYRCVEKYNGNCPMPHSINERKLEKWLLDNIEEDFKINVTMRTKEEKESPKKYKDRLTRLNNMYLLGNISDSEYRAQSADLQRKIAELSRTEKPKEIKFTESWKATYERLDTEHRRSFWRSIIKGVELDKDAQPIRILY